MNNRILGIAFLALFLTGCPASKTSRRYVILNNTGSTITNLSISAGNGIEQSWQETLPGQGWTHSRPFGPHLLIVSWRDETGDHEAKFFDKKTAQWSNADFVVELHPHGSLTGRIVEPPPAENGNVWALIPVYLLYCLTIGLVVGAPLSLAAVIAYVLFNFIRSGLNATVEGLHGDRSVFQFTIREIALLTTVVGLACGWLVQFLAMKH